VIIKEKSYAKNLLKRYKVIKYFVLTIIDKTEKEDEELE